MTMFFTCIVSLFIFSFIYNAFLGLNATMKASFGISSKMGITNHTFMKAAALGTWMGDFITAWMVTDMMLQVYHFYYLSFTAYFQNKMTTLPTPVISPCRFSCSVV